MNQDEFVAALLRALELERTSGMLTKRWLDAGGRESPVYDILERHAAEDENHGQSLWDLLVDRGIAPPETPEVETPVDYPQVLISLKEALVDLFDQTGVQGEAPGALTGRERQTLKRLRAEDDDQRALLSVYFPEHLPSV